MLRPYLAAPPFYVSEGGAAPITGVDLSEVRGAIHQARKMSIDYADEQGRQTRRTIRPIAMAYYVDVSLIGAWCELRNDFRSFRVDRISSSRVIDEHFSPDHGRLAAAWFALSKEAPGAPH
jgi:predicted DNA-binding transcriptional regulator YafY